MAAFQVLATASDLYVVPVVASPSRPGVDVAFQNLGPNPIYIETNGTATVAGGFRIDPSASVTMTLYPGQRVSAIAATASQVAPADTRILPVS